MSRLRPTFDELDTAVADSLQAVRPGAQQTDTHAGPVEVCTEQHRQGAGAEDSHVHAHGLPSSAVARGDTDRVRVLSVSSGFWLIASTAQRNAAQVSSCIW